MRLVSSLIAIALLATAAAAQPTLSAVLPTTVNLPAVGLASSETAQVNVVTSIASSAALPAPMLCAGTVTFYNSSGSAIGTAASFSISSGQIFSVTLPYSDVSGAAESRTAIRAVVTTDTNAVCTLNTNIETFDTATGVTHVHVEGPSFGLFPNLRLLGPPAH